MAVGPRETAQHASLPSHTRDARLGYREMHGSDVDSHTGDASRPTQEMKDIENTSMISRSRSPFIESLETVNYHNDTDDNKTIIWSMSNPARFAAAFAVQVRFQSLLTTRPSRAP